MNKKELDDAPEVLDSTKLKKEQKEESDSFLHQLKEKTITFSSKTKEKYDEFINYISPVTTILRKRFLRYSVSFILIGFVIYFYILFEKYRQFEYATIFVNSQISVSLLVPLALVFAFIALFYLTWGDTFFRKYRSPGLYMILLTAIFYTLIYSGLDEYLFKLSIAEWLTKLTGSATAGLANLFGLNVLSANWDENIGMTLLTFNSPNGIKSIGVDARCSGIHSLTIFLAIFLLMLFEARKRLKWNYRTALVALIGIVGTYIVNLMRVLIIIVIFYFKDWSIAGPIHDYLGYAFLILWVPIFWLFILPIGEKKKPKKPDEASSPEITEKEV
ncbi:MAG: exosortase/archaeosortase family protein [Candidatus Thorarchaeota archaeon]